MVEALEVEAVEAEELEAELDSEVERDLLDLDFLDFLDFRDFRDFRDLLDFLGFFERLDLCVESSDAEERWLRLRPPRSSSGVG